MDKLICRKEKFSILWKIGDYFCIDSLDFLCMIGENTLSKKNVKFNTFFLKREQPNQDIVTLKFCFLKTTMSCTHFHPKSSYTI